MKLEHRGVTYHSVPQAGCNGCAFDKRFDECPQTPDSAMAQCVADPFAGRNKTAIFITEDEYLKRRLRGEA